MLFPSLKAREACLCARIIAVARGDKATDLAQRTAFILFTDIYRSSYLAERFPKEYQESLEEHNELVAQAVDRQNGEIMKNLGDGFICLFNSADECLASSVELNKGLKNIPALAEDSPLLLRIVGHAGELRPVAGGDYFGRALNRASRICQVCHPGQVLISDELKSALREVPAEVDILDLGIHHLRDLAEPEHLYQVLHPEFALHKFPPLPTLGYRPNNLVYQPNAFIGRDREMAELKELILEKKQRLVSITAPGGYGKSRLATQLCANLLDYFANGVFEVLLAPVGSHERIVSVTADALGFQFYGRADPKQQLLDYLREKEMLISFDNFEHMMEGKELLTEILGYAPKVSILVTSREPLRLKAEKVYKLEPLPVSVVREDYKTSRGGRTVLSAERAQGRTALPPEAKAEEILPEAVQLFIDRATLVKHDFAVTEENLALVNTICEKLEGVPLSIELTSAWVDSFTLAELLSDIENQLEITSRMSDVPARHRSIRASLDWSYNLLTEQQREVLRAVSVFKGGFFYEAAMAVADKQDLRKLLAELSDKSWLFTREVLAKTRFFVRDAATHQYAFEKLKESDDYEPAVLVHAEYFSELIEREGERLKGPALLDAISILNLELANIYTALLNALKYQRVDALLSFAVQLEDYLDIVGKWDEGLPYYELLVKFAEELNHSELKIYAYLNLGRLLGRSKLGTPKDSEEALLTAKALAEGEGLQLAISSALQALGSLSKDKGDYGVAENYHRQALEIARALGNLRSIASALNNLGLVATEVGRYEEAEELLRESLAIYRETGNYPGLSASLHNLGRLALIRGKLEEADRLMRQSLEMDRRTGSMPGISHTLVDLGNIACAKRDYGEAKKLYEECLEVSREIGYRSVIGIVLMNLGYIALCEERYEDARKLLVDSLPVFRELEMRDMVATCLGNLGIANLELARHKSGGLLCLAEARDCLIEALGIGSELMAPQQLIEPLVGVSSLLMEANLGKEGALLALWLKNYLAKSGYFLFPLEADELARTDEFLMAQIPASELDELTKTAEKMTLEELTEFALRALEKLEAGD